MRVAVVTESFLPQVNGVTNSVCRVGEQLASRGHDVVVVAPGDGPLQWQGIPVVRTPAIALPRYDDFRLARPWPGLTRTLRGFRPDVVHLASPAILGAQAARSAHKLGIPTVAVYQTDLAAFAVRNGLRCAEQALWRWLGHVHGMAERTLAPSRQAVADLRRHGVDRVARWARGVDLHRFDPARRDEALRRELAPGGERIVGYVGRLAPEKELGLLRAVADLPGTRLVVVGDGPARASLERALPTARFLGFQHGDALGRTFASLDAFVHPGAHETFCQAAQEALASGVPVVAPAAGGLLDLVDPGVTGQLFRPHSAVSLHGALSSVLADPDARDRMATAARASVADRDWGSITDQLVTHYEEASA